MPVDVFLLQLQCLYICLVNPPFSDTPKNITSSRLYTSHKTSPFLVYQCLLIIYILYYILYIIYYILCIIYYIYYIIYYKLYIIYYICYIIYSIFYIIYYILYIIYYYSVYIHIPRSRVISDTSWHLRQAWSSFFWSSEELLSAGSCHDEIKNRDFTGIQYFSWLMYG